jgi:predicted transcriptional regulator of viral defense system
MKRTLEKLLSDWPSAIIADRDIACFFESHPKDAPRNLIQRAVSWGWLQRVKQGLFLIGRPFRKEKPSLFELAQHLYGPSYISMESALSFHQMIPEAVYATVSVCAKRSVEFETSLGLYLFHHVPTSHFYEGVERVEEGKGAYLIATPLKALGDYIYVNKKEYSKAINIAADLRIEVELLGKQPLELLNLLEKNYPNARVRKFYKHLHKELYK